MTRTILPLHTNPMAITTSKEQLDAINARIQQIKRVAEYPRRTDEYTQCEAYDIYHKANAVYLLLLQDYKYYESHDIWSAKGKTENARHIATTAALFFAEPGKEREEALKVFLVIANELSLKNRPLRIAIRVLGAVLIVATIAIVLCAGMGASLMLALYPAASLTSQIFAAGIGFIASCFLGGGCLAAGLGLLGCDSFDQAKLTGEEMHRLHGAFFKSTHDRENKVGAIESLSNGACLV